MQAQMIIWTYQVCAKTINQLRRRAAVRNPRRVLTGSQIRAGRGLLAWSAATLAQQAGVSEATVRRAEAVDGTPRMRSDNLLALQRAMEAAGVVFLDEGDMRPGGVGVRLRQP
jgi:ribosome-binding protein aMBF1 (putative translation factor)